MTTETWTIIAPVLAILIVGAALFWAIRRNTTNGHGSIASEQMSTLETDLAAVREAKTELEKRILVGEQKLLQLQKVETILSDREAELVSMREIKETAVREAATKEETLKAQIAMGAELRERLSELTAQLVTMSSELDSERKTVSNLRVEQASLQQTLQSDRQQTAEKLALLTDARDQLTKEFKLLSGEIFKRHSEELTNQNKEQLVSILDPMRVKIAEFQQGLQLAQTEAAKEQATLKEQIRTLSEASSRMTNETENLTRALKGKAQTQGAWGEMILSTILERSGLRKDQEYLVQQHAVSDDGARLRPDVIVNLPNGQHIIIDSKVSLTAFEQAINAESAEDRTSAMSRHLTSVKNHIRLLGGKEYHKATGGELDYVILFVPIEGALAAALDIEPDLTLLATEANVAIATPTTLMMALRTVSSLWQVERRNRNADDIAQRAGRLYDKFVGFVQDLTAVGSNLDNTRKSLDSAMSKLAVGQGNLVWQVEAMKKLGAKTQKSLPAELSERATDGIEGGSTADILALEVSTSTDDGAA